MRHIRAFFVVALLALTAPFAAAGVGKPGKEKKRPLVRDIKNKAEFDKVMNHHKLTGLPVVVDYYSDTCGPCRMIAPIYKRMAKDYEDRAVFLKVNTMYNGELSRDISSLPTFRFFVNGKRAHQFSGAGEQQLRAKVTELATKARQRPSHIHDVKNKGHFKTLLRHAASLPVVAAFVSKESEACKEIWPAVKKIAKQSFARAIFVKVNVDEDKETPEMSGVDVATVPVFHYYIKGKKIDELVGAAETQLKEKLKAAMKASKSAADEDDKQGSSDCKQAACPEVKVLTPQRPQQRSLLRLLSNREKVVVIGAGPAGLSSAVYAARAGLKPVLIAPDIGGQLSLTKEVENYPAIVDITGPSLIDMMRVQAEKFDTQFENTLVVSVDLTQKPFKLVTNKTDHNILFADTLIIATGANARWLGSTNEDVYRAKGVSTCAVCDGHLYKDREALVVGGGDSAMEEAMYLSRVCSKVTIVHRRDTFRASHILRERVLKNKKINIIWDSMISEFKGDGQKLTGVTIKNLKTDADSEMTVAAVFVAIGHDPNTQLFKDQLEMDGEGYIVHRGNNTHTSVDGVFACGDVADNVYRQAVTSAGTGAMAALDAERWLNEQEFEDEAHTIEKDKIDFTQWSVKDIKSAMQELGLSFKGCVEKKDFIDRLKQEL